MTAETLGEMVDACIDEKAHPDEWDIDGLRERFFSVFGFRVDKAPEGGGKQGWLDLLTAAASERYKAREATFGTELLRRLERIILLQILDAQWKDHLYGMDQLREGIGLRGYGQRDPLNEYKMEGYRMFEEMMARVRTETVRTLYLVQAARQEENLPRRRQQPITMGRGTEQDQPARAVTARREGAKVGRNDPCPCGSGKKYKKCCASVSPAP